MNQKFDPTKEGIAMDSGKRGPAGPGEIPQMVMPQPTHPVSFDTLAPLFENRTLHCVDLSIGTMDYYIYDPTKHGADPAKKYPLILFFHGSQMNLMEGAVLSATDMAVYASEEYQNMLGGAAYIVLPRANEKMGPDGITGFWGFWDGESMEIAQSNYLKTLGVLLEELEIHNSIDRDRVAVGGVSAGGLMAWQFAIAYPKKVSHCFPCSSIYVPSDGELDKLQEADVKVWVLHGRRDELATYEKLTGSIIEKLKKRPNIRTTILDDICTGDKKIVHMSVGGGREMGQHQSQYCIGANMLYDDGTPYDPAYPNGFIDWIIK